MGLKQFFKLHIPAPVWKVLVKAKCRVFGHESISGETAKARKRRENEGFFEKFCRGKGLDIGFGGDPIMPDCRGWDFEHGDAQYLKGIDDLTYDYVYSSHTLEHMVNPEVALKNWWRVVKPGGYLLLYVPHRDLYEKKKALPSQWNSDHKHFFLLDHDEEPATLGVLPLVKHSLDSFEIVYGKECAEGHTITEPTRHSDGEYSIEVVVKKL